MLIATLAATLLAAPEPDPEVARVQTHLQRAEQVLEMRDTSALTRDQRERRARAIEHLREYRSAGVFPKNRDFAGRRMPYFIDADGTRCAMAHLIEASGERALVERIARERNNAFVKELADEQELIRWLDDNGITAEEAARVQPTYGCFPAAQCICGGWTGKVTGVLELQTQSDSVSTVLAVHGDVGLNGGRSWQVGDELTAAPAGAHWLAFFGRYDSGNQHVLLKSAPLDDANQFSCTAYDDGALLIATKDQAVAAVESANCEASLGQLDKRWSNTDHCEGGCAATKTNGLSPLFAVALAGLLLARRRPALR